MNSSAALERLRAWQALQGEGREVVVGDGGLLGELREAGQVSRYEWEAGELVAIVEPDGSRLSYRYGEDGRLLAVERNGEPIAAYRYDGEGRLLAVDRDDGPLAHAYDAQGRLLRTLRGDASPFLYRWDGERVAAARSDREETRFGYDAQGKVVAIEQTLDGSSLSLRFDFDAAGRLATIDFESWSQRIGFDWDAQGRPAAIDWNGTNVARFGADDAARLTHCESADGLRERTWHEPADGRPLRKILSRGEQQEIWRCELERDAAFRLVREGARRYAYDALGRLAEAHDGAQAWSYRFDAMDEVEPESAIERFDRDAQGRVQRVVVAGREVVHRHNQAGELSESLRDGERIARCVYDHKGRLLLKTVAGGGSERYLYGADDALLAIADGRGRPLTIFLRLPTGLVALVDFRGDPAGRLVCLHHDAQGNLIYAGTADGALEGPFASDPWGLPLRTPEPAVPYVYRGRHWHAELGLYRIGGRWYDPRLRRFLTPDTHTGAPDDARLVNPFRRASEQRMLRTQVLGEWLRQPRLRNRQAYCANDPVNRFDPDGHWSFGGVLLSLLGMLWTLPNTAFGLAIEVTCLLGEVVRWLVWLFSAGNVSWQTPGFDVAASGRLNAFALVFKGGWLGSFESLLGITFGNVIFVNGKYEEHSAFKALPDPVFPAAYNGEVRVPKSQALYEHELRHVNQYGWFGPFFHLGLPLFGVYEWDVILNGYENAALEKDARDHGGF